MFTYIQNASPPQRRGRGQGLVEYALILVLVAVVVIAVLTLLGPTIGNVYSNIKIALAPGDGKSPQVTCSGLQVTGSHSIDMEAVVSDPQGAATINYVQFYIDGVAVSGGPEYHYHYCLYHGDDPCNHSYGVSAGNHTIRAIVTDNDGNTGECSASINVP